MHQHKNRKSWHLEWIILAVFISTTPYLAGCLLAPSGAVFTGNIVDVLDQNTYYADMWLGFRGEWWYTMPFSAHASSPSPFFLFYILLGHIARISGISIPVIYQFARIACALLFGWSVVLLLKSVLKNETEKQLALALILFTGGWGWLMVLFKGINVSGASTPDIWWIESITFNSILGFPHFTLSMACMNLILVYGVRWFEDSRWHDAVLCGLMSLVLVLVHTQQILTMFLVLVVYLVRQNIRSLGLLAKKAFMSGVLILPLLFVIGWLCYLIRFDEGLNSWAAQGNTYTPTLDFCLVIYGPVLLLALLGGFHAVRKKDNRLGPVLVWFLVVPLLLYVPVNFQRRFIEGWHVPVAVLAAIGWKRVMCPVLQRWTGELASNIILGVIFTSVALSPLFFLTIMFARVSDRSAESRYYIQPDVQGAFRYLRENGDFNDVVLTRYTDGNIAGNMIPAWSGVRSFLGHWSLTPNYQERVSDVAFFLDPATTDHERQVLLQEYHIDYVYLDSKDMGQGKFDPESAQYLTPVYVSADVVLYRVVP